MVRQRQISVHDSNRIEWIDNVRGFAICMIVLAHIIQYFPAMKSVNSYICGFHVSIFFMLSGCLAFAQREKEELLSAIVIKKAKSLLIPYAVFSLVNFSAKLLVFLIQGKYTQEVLNEELLELFITGNGTVWFLMTLFWVEIIYYSIKKVIGIKTYVYIAIMIVTSILPFVLNENKSPGTMFVKRIFMALAFYYAGFFFMWIIKNKNLLERRGISVAIVCLLVGYIVWRQYGNGIAYFEAEFSNAPTAITVNVLESIGFILLLAVMPTGKSIWNRCLNYLGRNSIIIMLIHPLLLMCYVYPIGFPIDRLSAKEQVVFSLGSFIVLMVLQIPFIMIIRRYFSWMIGKRK